MFGHRGMIARSTYQLEPLLIVRVVWLAVLIGLACGWSAIRARADDAVATYQITNGSTTKDAKGYAVFVDVTKDKIDLTKTNGKILTDVRLEPRPPLGTLIVFENAKNGIPPGKTDDIQIRFKDLPAKKTVKFSKVSTLRSGVGRDAPVIEEEVPRAGFKMEKDPIYAILNTDSQPPFTVTNLQALVNVPEVADTTLFLDFSNSYGFTTLGSGMTSVDSNSSPDIQIPGTVDPGNWVYVRGLMEINGMEVPFVHGANFVPEPSGLVLSIFGVMGMVGYTCGLPRKRRHSRHAPV